MNYDEALEFIHSVEWLGSRPGLSRTRELLAGLGNPERDMKFIHVAGTNGKGSTCSMLNSVLMESGYKVGLYTSPYIVRFNERMQINGCPIPDEELAELVSIVKPVAESMEDKPTEFEIITAVAFLYYKRNNCDLVVLEVGMGGALDSTNVIEAPLVSVITGIALDHTAFLGDNISRIASEKAGIIKYKCPVVYGGRDDVAYEVIYQRGMEKHINAVRTCLDELEILSADISGTTFNYKGYIRLKLSLLGTYQPENAATVIETVEILNESGYNITEEQLRRGLYAAKWRARFELLSEKPTVIFDGGHNIQGITAAVDSIKRFFSDEKIVLLMGVLADKDYEDMIALLAPHAKRVFAVTPPSPRALDSEMLAMVFAASGVASVACESISDGVESAYNYAKQQNMPLVMLGSLYMYGEVYNSFEKIANNPF